MDAEAKTNEWQVFKEPYNNWVHKLQNVFHKFTTSKWFWITSHYPHESCVTPDPENIIQNTRSIQVFTIWSESNLLSWKKKRPKEKEKINRKEDPISLFWWARKKPNFCQLSRDSEVTPLPVHEWKVKGEMSKSHGRKSAVGF